MIAPVFIGFGFRR
ncbi:hypothetical protein AVEN_244133-1, partial [Araneus ventricosus]